jgi:transposase
MGFMKLALEDREKDRLIMVMTSPEMPQKLNLRAGIVLSSAAGLTDNQVAAEYDVSLHTVGKWRRRYLKDGIHGLKDGARTGKPRRIRRDEVAIRIADSLSVPPPDGGRWTVRKMAKAIGLPPATTGRIWQELRDHPRLSLARLHNPTACHTLDPSGSAN